MRKVVLSMYQSLDGVVENPVWTMPFWNEEAAQFARDQLFASDALVLGRVTYQGFAQAWPGRQDEQGFADRMNALPKFVASRTLRQAGWNARIMPGDAAQEVARLKRQPGQDLLIYGSGTLVQTLMAHHLIDEYRLWLYPVVLGRGQRLFPEGAPPLNLKRLDVRPLASGVVILTYGPQDG
ncbi:bifunctional deaminase-reductase-like protein [Deinococcus geothermalis DSM 11300]|uniref:Bifunctional deaminase-reductase-like protein n=1 Tax=Deinococcus geothermalis (strain DSM 11300 / CIP 105573 / AG-3a) TaxID=319795 RepID=Q1IZT6_DEIGD|nr:MULTISPECIES: dihydrofolate reductase family protein [Deinococcus]ABF45248.1 bifunctional deaminase-reductase-like protein [Deinococcus geothermalis DSM 11300]MBI0444530.1 dihydrofolate reductase [Deinococcus sp. DB0503]TDE86752.1 dihydrofolate reductase [Deinococcus sp. S9]